MTRRIVTTGRDWSVSAPPMPPARRAYIHGPLQPMAEDTPASLSRWAIAGIIGGAVMLIAVFG